MSLGIRGPVGALRGTLDLYDLGLALMRQNLRRADPTATDQEIDQRLQRWLHNRPGAEFGDCEGVRRNLDAPSE